MNFARLCLFYKGFQSICRTLSFLQRAPVLCFLLQRIAHFACLLFLLLELLPLTLSALLPICFSSLISSFALLRALALSSRNCIKSEKELLFFKSNAFACFSCFSSFSCVANAPPFPLVLSWGAAVFKASSRLLKLLMVWSLHFLTFFKASATLPSFPLPLDSSSSSSSSSSFLSSMASWEPFFPLPLPFARLELELFPEPFPYRELV